MLNLYTDGMTAGSAGLIRYGILAPARSERRYYEMRTPENFSA